MNDSPRLWRCMTLLVSTVTYGFIAGRWDPPYFALYAGVPLGFCFTRFIRWASA